MKTLPFLLFVFSLCGTLDAQVVGIGYQKVQSNQVDMRDMSGAGLRVRFGRPIDVRYDYYSANGQRFDIPCVLPDDCAPEVIAYSSYLHSFSVAARIDAVRGRPFHVYLLPELGVVTGKITKHSVSTNVGASGEGWALGAGGAVELSTASFKGTPLGGWVGLRYRRFVVPGEWALNEYAPHRDLKWIRSAEVGLVFSF